jgi:hypothetical protein
MGMNDTPRVPDSDDPGLRRMMTWVLIALVLVVLLAIIVVELTLRAVGLR